MTHDMTTDNKTFDFARFLRLMEGRRQILEGNRRFHQSFGNIRAVDRYDELLSEFDNIMGIVDICSKKKEVRWFVDDINTGIKEDAPAKVLKDSLEEHLPAEKWKNEVILFVCNRYDNPEEARDRLWDALASGDPMTDIVETMMDDIRALRKAGEMAEDNYGGRFFIQLQEVDE